MRKLFYLVIFALSVNLASAAVTLKPDTAKVQHHLPLIVKADSTTDVQIRSFNKETLKKYSEQRDFQYGKPVETETWLDRFFAWLLHRFDHLLNYRGLSVIGIVINILMLLLIIAGVVTLIYFVLKSGGINLQDIFKRKSTAAAVPYSEFFEDINAINFDAEIENAVAKHNYRFAVRLLYLKCLKQLSDAGLIKWEIDKTNTQYIYELQNAAQRSEFGLLTRQFEYVWYGEFLIDNQVYSTIANSFRDFNRSKA
jgi:hypothetical protein